MLNADPLAVILAVSGKFWRGQGDDVRAWQLKAKRAAELIYTHFMNEYILALKKRWLK